MFLKNDAMYKTINYDGIEVSLRISGDTGRGLLLLHGWNCSAELMADIQDFFASHMHTIAPDFPGHGNYGKAAPPKTVWGIPEYAALVSGIIKENKLFPCDIIAHSFGCRVALYLAATEPQMIGRLVLTGAAGIPNHTTSTAAKRRKHYRFFNDGLNTLESLHLFKNEIPVWREALIQRFGSEDYKALTPQMREVFKKVISFDVTPLLEEVKASTILYWGAKDTETPLWMGKIMEKGIPDAALIVEEGSGHFAFLEHQSTFLRISEEFLLKGR